MRTKMSVQMVLVTMMSAIMFFSCHDRFLEQPPLGVYDEASLTNRKGVNGMLINAYATLDGQQTTWYAGASNWLWGSVCGGDAYKGSEPSDQVDGNPVMRFTELAAGNPYNENKWNGTWDGVGQANLVLRLLPKATDIPAAEAKQIEAEARFLRGHHHFEGKKMWNKIPYIDETVTDFKQPNTADIWPNIEADLKFAYDNLDEIKTNKGRVNKWAAGAYLAKALMFQQKYAAAKAILDLVYTSGKNSSGAAYALASSYGANFRVSTEFNNETVFAIQASYGDGSTSNGNYDNALNYPHGGGSKPGGCCGFFQPSQSFLNSFTVNAVTGLPDPQNFNSTMVTSDEDKASADPFVPYAGALDARLDWNVGRRGIPYYDWGIHPGRDWIRQVSYGGPYSPKKNTYYKADLGGTAGIVGWGWANNALNYTIMRFADVILMLAECEVEVGSLDKARQYVNEVRARAANPAGWVMDGAVPAANYKVGLYAAATAPFTTQAAARTAVRFERKLELGMEGHRFFDLVRWGVAATEINAYLTVEATRRPTTLNGAVFTAGKHEYKPIPTFAISQSIKDGSPTLTQNPGY